MSNEIERNMEVPTLIGGGTKQSFLVHFISIFRGFCPTEKNMHNTDDHESVSGTANQKEIKARNEEEIPHFIHNTYES